MWFMVAITTNILITIRHQLGNKSQSSVNSLKRHIFSKNWGYTFSFFLHYSKHSPKSPIQSLTTFHQERKPLISAINPKLYPPYIFGPMFTSLLSKKLQSILLPSWSFLFRQRQTIVYIGYHKTTLHNKAHTLFSSTSKFQFYY